MESLGIHTPFVLIAAVLTLPAAIATAQTPEAPYVISIAYEGSGCPAGSVASSVANDRSSFTLIFDQFVATTGTGVPPSEGRKTCLFTLRLRLAPGWQVFTYKGDQRGYVQVAAGARASAGALHILPPPSGTGKGANGVDESSVSTFVGPTSRDYVGSDEFEVTAHAPNTCSDVPGRETELKILVEVGLQESLPASGQITMDSLDGMIVRGPRQKNAKNCP